MDVIVEKTEGEPGDGVQTGAVPPPPTVTAIGPGEKGPKDDAASRGEAVQQPETGAVFYSL